jgi:ElaB/YqjD/DUF883 family membrane-anchored ribosome-binding protein
VANEAEREELQTRLARIKELIDKLEHVCRESGQQSEMLIALRRAMNAASRALRQIK